MKKNTEELVVCKECGEKLDTDTSRCRECWDDYDREISSPHRIMGPVRDEPFENEIYPVESDSDRMRPLDF